MLLKSTHDVCGLLMSASTSHTSQTHSWGDDQVSWGISCQTWTRASVNIWTVWAVMWQRWIQGYMTSQRSLAGVRSEGVEGSQYHQCLHYPGTAETPQLCKAAKSRTRRNQRIRMWSNNGAGQQLGHLGLAAPSSPLSRMHDHHTPLLNILYSVLRCLGCSVWACSHLWGERGAIGNSSFSSLLWQTPTKWRQIPHMDTGSYSNLEESVSYSLGRNVYRSGIRDHFPGLW